MSRKRKKEDGKKPASVSGASQVLELKKRTRKYPVHLAKNLEKFTTAALARGEVKMSDVIMTLADPYIEQCHDDENAIRNVISAAVLAWNMSWMPQEESITPKKTWFGKLLSAFFPAREGVNEDMKPLLAELIQRRRIMFPNLGSLIVKHRVKFTDDNINLSIASMPLTKMKEG